MKNKLMITASAIILMGVAPAIAENNNQSTPNMSTVSESELEQGWENTKEFTSETWQDTKDTVSNVADEVSDASMDAYNETRAVLDMNTDIDAYVENDTRVTADTVIGQDVFNQQNETIANVSDFVVDENGQVQGLIISYGGVLGVGNKEIMLDFDTFKARADNSGYVTQLTKTNMDNYPAFNFAQLSRPMHLATNLMDASIVNPSMNELAEVDNIVIENGNATKLVISYMDGIVPEKAMIDFTDASIILDADQDVHFELSMNQTQKFRNFIQ